MGVILHAYPVHGELHIQRKANWKVVKHSLPFTTNCTDRTFFLWRLHLAQPLHPGHSTILLRSESPSSECAKLHTSVAGNNRDYRPQSLFYCVFAPHIYGCYSLSSRSWWIAHSTQCQLRGCNNISFQIQSMNNDLAHVN